MDPQAVQESTFHHAMEIVLTITAPIVSSLLAWMVNAMVKGATAFAELKTTVLNIRDNHLAHIAKDIEGVKDDICNVRGDVKELRGQFVNHIAVGKD